VTEERVAVSTEEIVTRKVRNHIIPWIIVLYVVAFLDRVNTGYAALTMNKALGITADAFGLVAGIFFIGYFIFEVPSNMFLHKIGARIWIARILVSWGIVAMLTAVAQSVMHLYILRFMLGAAEAGFFPGIILYITFWFRGKEQARAFALFMTALALSSIIGAPMSGLILDHIHWAGIASWRWLYVLEGAPAVICGVLTFYLLPDRPNNAKWLTQKEKAWLNSELEKERKAKLNKHSMTFGQVFRNGRVWQLSMIYLCIVIGLYGIGFWMPQIIKALSSVFSNTTVGYLTMIPYIVGAVAMIWIGRRSDRMQERRWHAALPPLVGAIALVLLGQTSSPVWSIVLLSIVTAGIYSFFGPFWSLPGLFLTEASAAVGIAIINSVGNLGGFIGPYIIGAVKGATGSVYSGLIVLAVFLVLGTVLILSIRKQNAAAVAADDVVNM
jgi:MFS transporter, ACS family, tartrate transporter